MRNGATFSEALYELCDRFGLSDFEHANMLRAIRSTGPGRKPKYQPEYVEQARKLCEVFSATDEELAIYFDVKQKIIYDWRIRHPAFAEACRVGKAVADDRVERALYTRAVGTHVDTEKIFMPKNASKPVRAKTKEYIPPDVGAAKLWLTNRRPEEWRERKEIGIGGEKPGEPVKIAAIPAEMTEADLEYLRSIL